MQLMPPKIICSLFCLMIGAASFSQDLTIHGNDSVSIEIKTDTARKKVFVYRTFLNKDTAITDSFKLSKPKLAALTISDSMAFYKAIKGSVTDSVRQKVVDTVRKLLSKSVDFKIILQPPVIAVEPGFEPPPEQKGLLDIIIDNTILLIIFIILIVTIVGLGYLYMNKKSQPAPPVYDVPDGLIRIFPGMKKGKTLESTVDNIRDAYQRVVIDLKNEQRKNGEGDRILKETTANLEATKSELLERTRELEAKKQELVRVESDNESVKQWAALVLDKYFIALARHLEQKQIKNEEEAFQLILSNLIPFAIHSASILKKQIREASELDSRNIQLLQGENSQPTDVITANTQFDVVDPLAYYIYKLLQKHHINNLKEVLVKGYKIGN